jgi:hypothetical protein
MYADLEQALTRELDDVASTLVVPPLPALPDSPPQSSRRQAVQPLLIAAVALVAVMATIGALLLVNGGSDDEPSPAPTPTATATATDAPLSTAAPRVPVLLDLQIYRRGRAVPGRWWAVSGTSDRWIGQRIDGSWRWANEAQVGRFEGALEQPPVISPGGDHVAYVTSDGDNPVLNGFTTDPAGEGYGLGLALPAGSDPPARAVGVTDEGLVVALGSSFEVLWDPLVGGDSVDLADTAPGQVVLDVTAAGVVVNAGDYASTDTTSGDPYLATLGEDGSLTRIRSLPTHDVLEAGPAWMAWVPPGTVGGEASSARELQVERVDGGGAGVLTPPEGWVFLAPGFRWESPDSLVAHVVTEDGGDEGIVRCRPESPECVLVPLR